MLNQIKSNLLPYISSLGQEIKIRTYLVDKPRYERSLLCEPNLFYPPYYFYSEFEILVIVLLVFRFVGIFV